MVTIVVESSPVKWTDLKVGDKISISETKHPTYQIMEKLGNRVRLKHINSGVIEVGKFEDILYHRFD